MGRFLDTGSHPAGEQRDGALLQPLHGGKQLGAFLFFLTPVFSFADPAILQDAGSQEEQPRRAYPWPGEART